MELLVALSKPVAAIVGLAVHQLVAVNFTSADRSLTLQIMTESSKHYLNFAHVASDPPVVAALIDHPLNKFLDFCFPALRFSAFCFSTFPCPCFSAFIVLCFSASCCLSASPLFCFSLHFCFSNFCAALLLLFPASLLTCFSASLLSCFSLFFCFSYSSYVILHKHHIYIYINLYK